MCTVGSRHLRSWSPSPTSAPGQHEWPGSCCMSSVHAVPAVPQGEMSRPQCHIVHLGVQICALKEEMAGCTGCAYLAFVPGRLLRALC